MEIRVDFPGGTRVDAHVGAHIVSTEQEGPLPTPFEVFLASLATCAGFYALAFCRTRGIPTEGLHVIQRDHANEKGVVESFDIEVVLPPSFPEAQRAGIERAVSACKVKKTLLAAPAFKVTTNVAREAA